MLACPKLSERTIRYDDGSDTGAWIVIDPYNNEDPLVISSVGRADNVADFKSLH